jgi:hypothetical protein
MRRSKSSGRPSPRQGSLLIRSTEPKSPLPGRKKCHRIRVFRTGGDAGVASSAASTERIRNKVFLLCSAPRSVVKRRGGSVERHETGTALNRASFLVRRLASTSNDTPRSLTSGNWVSTSAGLRRYYREGTWAPKRQHGPTERPITGSCERAQRYAKPERFPPQPCWSNELDRGRSRVRALCSR